MKRYGYFDREDYADRVSRLTTDAIEHSDRCADAGRFHEFDAVMCSVPGCGAIEEPGECFKQGEPGEYLCPMHFDEWVAEKYDQPEEVPVSVREGWRNEEVWDAPEFDEADV